MASPFASATTSDPIPLPGDPSQTYTVRKLTGEEVERAQAVHAAGIANGRGWANKFRSAIARGVATDAQVAEAATDPLLGYDRTTLVKCGLTGWTFTDAKGRPKAFTAAAKADLVDEAMEVVAIDVLKLTKPGLFKTAEELEADRKNA